MQQPCVKSELCLFDPPMAQVSMEKATTIDVYPATTLDGGPIEFLISATQDDYYDLNDTMLYLKLKIVNSDGTNLDAAAKPYTANLTLCSLFSDVSLHVNDVLVEGGHFLYPYKSYLSTVLQFEDAVKDTQMGASGYKMETSEREKWYVGSKSIEFMGPLHLDLFQQSKYMLPGVALRVKLCPSKADFVIINGGKKGAMVVKFESAILKVRKVKVAPSVSLGHEMGLNRHNAIYPIQQSEMLTYTIAQGSMNHSQDNLFRGQLPKLLVMGMVKNDAFVGNAKDDPTKFIHASVNHVSLYRDGECVPHSQPLQPDFDKELVIQSYMAMIQGLEMFHVNQSNGISFADYISDLPLFVFNLTPDLSASGACGQPYQTGNLRMELKFAKSLPQAINVILFAIRDGKIEICKDRKVLKS